MAEESCFPLIHIWVIGQWSIFGFVCASLLLPREQTMVNK